jgi:hypothetical protein
MALNNDFKIKNRLYSTGGAFIGNYTGAGGPYSINTTGHILSANVNLLTLFAPFGTVANATAVYSTVNANSASWSAAYTAVAPSSANWNSNYTNTFAQSAKWSAAYTTTNVGSASWNGAYTAVAPNSANWNSNYTNTFAQSAKWSEVYSAFNTLSTNILRTPISSTGQGNITIPRLFGSPESITIGALGTGGSPQFLDLTVTGNLSVLGDFTYLNTSVSVTSSLSVVNVGTGPALYVKQAGTTPIAYFIDANGPGSSGDIIFENNGFVGLGTASPTHRLTIKGNISADGATLSGAKLINLSQTLSTTGNRIVTVEADGTLTYDALGVGEAIITGVGLASNKLVKSTNNPNILSAGSITDTVSGVAIDRNVPLIIGVDDGVGNDWYVVKQTYFKPIGPSGTSIATLLTSMPSPNLVQNVSPNRLMLAKYTVLLYTDTNHLTDYRTSFEVLAPVATTITAGTAYAIVDTTTPLLNDIDMSIANISGRTTAVLTISSTTACIGLIEATGYYGPTTYNQ